MNDESNQEDQIQTEQRDRRKHQPATKDPDIHLDVPQLEAEEISLSLLGILKADIKGLDTELLLDADLDNLVDLLKRVIQALDEDDEESGGSGLADTLERLIGSAAKGASGGGAEDQSEKISQMLETLRSQGGGHANGASSESEAGDGQSVSHTVAENGDILKATFDENGEVLDEEIVGNVSDLPTN